MSRPIENTAKNPINRPPQGAAALYGAAASAALLGGLLILASCATPTQAPTAGQGVLRAASPTLQETPVAFTYCVPYAREASGVQLYGDAWTWWRQADGKYAKASAPQKGAVLTLKKTGSLPMGHVAVVAAVSDDPRKIMVDHANWGDNSNTRGKIHKRQPVIDVSKNNDWSEVRFMNVVGSFGRVYAAHGFIYTDDPKSPRATRTAMNETR